MSLFFFFKREANISASFTVFNKRSSFYFVLCSSRRSIMVSVEWTKRRREAVQRGGRTSERNQNHKPDVTAPVCSQEEVSPTQKPHRKFLFQERPLECQLPVSDQPLPIMPRDTPATFPVFSCENAAILRVLFFFICKPIVSSETTQWRNSLVFLTQSYEPDSNKPQRKSVLSSSAVFTPAAGRVVEQSHAHSAEVWEMWFSLTSTCNHTTWGSVRTSGATEAREARGRKAFNHFLSRVCDRTENKLSQDRF